MSSTQNPKPTPAQRPTPRQNKNLPSAQDLESTKDLKSVQDLKTIKASKPAHHLLFKSAAVIAATTLLSSASGFLFWIVATHRYSAKTIGTTSAITSLIPLVATLGGLGLAPAVTKAFAHSPNPVKLVWRSTTLAFLAGALFAIVLLLTDPALENQSILTSIYLALTCALLSASTVTTATIVVAGKTHLLLFETTAGILVKLVMIISTHSPNAVLTSTLTGMVAATLTSALVVAKLTYPIKGNSKQIPSLRSFAIFNWLAGAFSLIPAALLPVFVYTRSGATLAAATGVAALFLPLLNLPSSTIARSLFAQASRTPDQLSQLAKSSFKAMLLLATATLALTLLIASPLLALFGSSYGATGSTLLKLLALSALLATGNYLADTLLLLRGYTHHYLFVNIAGTIAICLLSWFTAPHGAIALGWGWVAGQAAYSAVAWTTLRLANPPKPVKTA